MDKFLPIRIKKYLITFEFGSVTCRAFCKRAAARRAREMAVSGLLGVKGKVVSVEVV